MGIYNSFLDFTNNSAVNLSVGLFWLNSSFVLIASDLIFKENECQNSILLENYYTSLSINEGSIMIVKYNIMEYSSIYGAL